MRMRLFPTLRRFTRPATDLGRDETGLAALFWALSLPFMILFLALVADAGLTFTLRRELQNTADAAALAGAQSLGSDFSAAIAEAERMASLGSDDLLDVSVAVADGGTSLQVTVTKVNERIVPGLGIGPDVVTATATATLTVTSLDFEGLEPGDQPNELRWEAGIGGEPVDGWVTVTGPGFGPMIFDTFCGGSRGGCSGGDSDLFQLDQGLALIISEDGDSSDPDDSAAGGVVEFDFSHLGGGSVVVGYLVLIDAEEGGTVELWGDGELLDIVILEGVRDGEKAVRFVSAVSGVDFMRITLNGSGAIDDIGYTTAIHLTA